MDPRDVIRTKRDGGRLSNEQITAFLGAYVAGEAEDYHAAALLTAIFCRGLEPQELLEWTSGMVHSGAQLSWEGMDGPVLDKHSTGGVGDKASLVLAPALIAAGAKVPMISGRGLGHTGGTLDKLEAVPGLKTELSLDQIQSQVKSIGGVIAAQTPELVPADRKLYALRDAAGLVESVPLIASSILSKKLAEGLDALVLDIKFGSGSFLPSRKDGAQLASAMSAIAAGLGLPMTVVESSMEQPLGRAVGHANEVNEALDVLAGDGPADLLELSLHLGAEVLVAGGVEKTFEEGRARLQQTIESGDALEVFYRMLRAQGGQIEDGERLVIASDEYTVRMDGTGAYSLQDCRLIGVALMELGGARTRIGGPLDHQVGIRCEATRGQELSHGEPLFTIFHRGGKGLEAAEAHLRSALHIHSNGAEPIAAPTTLTNR